MRAMDLFALLSYIAITGALFWPTTLLKPLMLSVLSSLCFLIAFRIPILFAYALVNTPL